MKISHEVPICLLEDSREFNDYDYALVHLFETHPKYFEFYKKSVELGREVVLDNSIFELGTAFDMLKFSEWVGKLEPTYYIIPDVLESSEGTVQNLLQWNTRYSDGINSKSIGVLQGKSFDGLFWCLRKFIEYGVDKIAVSFDYSFYETLFKHPNKLVSWCFGRFLLINKMIEYCEEKEIELPPVHLLGCSSISEFSLYDKEKYHFIESVDTSNPIVHGIKKLQYGFPELLYSKPSVKLFELIEEQISPETYKLIRENVDYFRKVVNSR